MMMPFRQCFITYTSTPRSYVVLANSQRSPCLGRGDICINMGGNAVILRDVLHIPSLRCPLFSVRCHRRYIGCSFIADNEGCYLTFPSFTIEVNDRTDCTVVGSIATKADEIHFDANLAGRVSAVSDNTRFRDRRRPSCLQKSCRINNRKVSFSDEVINSTSSLVDDPLVAVLSDVVSDENITPETSVDTENTSQVPLISPSAGDTSSDNVIPTSFFRDLGLDATDFSSSPLSSQQISQISQACIDSLTKHGCITMELIRILDAASPRKSSPKSSSSTPEDRPELLSCDKVPSFYPNHRRFSIPELHRYIGFRQLKDWNSILNVAQPKISFVTTNNDIPLELGDVANIKKSRRNTSPIPRPPAFLDVVHCDIAYGDCKAIGGARFCLILVDRATRYCWIYALKSLCHTNIIKVFQQFQVDAGSLPHRLYTDFDSKLVAGPTGQFLLEHGCKVRASPSGRQDKNGLVERAWQTAVGMARSYITDMQMPRHFWYWAIRQAVFVMNYLPCTVSNILTSSHELVYGVKPDYRLLFRLFSTGYFKHSSDGSRRRDGITEATSMAGIAIGHCRKSEGLLFYCPHNRQFYSSVDYKLDEGRSTPTTFNLRYDGGIFVGLYDHSPSSLGVEPYPEGTSVSMAISSPGTSDVVHMRGSVISVPLPLHEHQIPLSDQESPPYVIRLVDGSIHRVTYDLMEDIVISPNLSSSTISFPSWMSNNQKVMYLRDGTYIKGIMEFDLDNSSWRFSQRKRNGDEIWGTTIPHLARDFQLYIDDGTLVPGWHTQTHFLQSTHTPIACANHVSASGLLSSCAPGSALKAFHSSNPDRAIWKESYNEEFDGLCKNDTFEIITDDEYKAHLRRGGAPAIPSMSIFTVKLKNGIPHRAKCRIVALGNKESTQWTKADCYAPVVSLPVVRLLAALAVRHKRTLKQGDFKNAFVQAPLPDHECTIIRPPPGCFRSGHGGFWRLRKSLYGLRRAPRHWYKLVSSILTSPELGLKQCKNEPCVFVGCPLPGQPPLYLVLYVDDFVYFSPSTDVESFFESALKQRLNVDFMGDAEWFLGIQFSWHFSSSGELSCRLSQEGYIHSIVTELGLTHANTCPAMTPFRSGLPVDAIPHIELSDTDRAPIIDKMRSWLGMLNWLCQGTRPDIATITSLLATYTSCPSPGHLDAIKYIGRYLKSTADLGLMFSSMGNPTLEAFIHFPVSEDVVTPAGVVSPVCTGFCDANWGPQDASVPPVGASLRPVSLQETRSICGHVLFMAGAPIKWHTHKEKRTSRSSCEAEIKATDECVKSVQQFRHLLDELGLLNSSTSTPIFNDNRGAVDWSQTCSTKGLRHLNIRENCVRESIQFNEVSVSHIAGVTNPADLFSKEFKSDVVFRSLRGLLLFYPSSLPSCDGVPRLDGGYQSSELVQESHARDTDTDLSVTPVTQVLSQT